MFSEKQKNGFTILELLVVVAIIAILAAITMVAVSNSRNKTKVAQIQSYMDQFGKQAYVLGNGENYTSGYFWGQCPSSTASAGGTILQNQALVDLINLAKAEGNDHAYCIFNNNGTRNWVIAVDLPNGSEVWCVDNKGARKKMPGGYTGTYSNALDSSTSLCK